MDTLQQDPKGQWLVTNPSILPENGHPFGSAVCVGPTMDQQILRDLFANTMFDAHPPFQTSLCIVTHSFASPRPSTSAALYLNGCGFNSAGFRLP